MERLRKKCDEASHIDSKLRGLKEKNIIELEAEVKRTVSLIERSGLEIPDGSSSVNPLSQALKVLSELSLEFHLGSPRPAQISLLLSELQLESAKIPMLQFERDEEEDERRKAKVTALKDLSRNRRIHDSTSRDIKRGLASVAQSAKNFEFLKEKQREYGKKAEKTESLIRSSSGFGKEFAHEKIVALKKELAMTESEILAPLRLKLESYRQLPPDVGLARVKVAEAEMELSALSDLLKKQINVMHV